MKFSMTEQEKGDLLIQVTAWTGLTIQINYTNNTSPGNLNDVEGMGRNVFISKSPILLSYCTEKSRNNHPSNHFLGCSLSGPYFTVIISSHSLYIIQITRRCIVCIIYLYSQTLLYN
jgi:hypothetical protein